MLLKNKLKKNIAISGIIGTVLFLMPKPAEATFLIRHSGSPNGGESFLEFDIDTNVPNTHAEPTRLGTFVNAVINAKYSCPTTARIFCGDESEIILNPATLNASLINVEEDLDDYQLVDYSDPFSVFSGGVKYEATLRSRDDMSFYEIGILVKPPYSIDILNLRNLRDVLGWEYFVGVKLRNSSISPFIGSSDGGEVGSGNDSLRIVDNTPISVPETDTKTSLLCIGFMGISSLLRKYVFFNTQL
jgi:hypothetical protein